MRQRFQLALLIWIIAQADLVCAHAVVTAYSLKSTPIHAHQEDKVQLTFNSKIELGLSQVYLVRKGDKHELLKVESGHKQGEVIVYIPALEPGEYAIKFKVFAADGHLTEDVIHFSVS
jgi:methionine-rich copper-binding protein CopC